MIPKRFCFFNHVQYCIIVILCLIKVPAPALVVSLIFGWGVRLSTVVKDGEKNLWGFPWILKRQEVSGGARGGG